MTNETITLLVTTSQATVEGQTIDVIDAPADVQALWQKTTSVGHWVAQFPQSVLEAYGVTPTPAPRGGTLDAASCVFVGRIRVRGTDYDVLIGTGTTPALACMKAALENDRALDGVESVTKQPVAALLKSLTRPGGGRRVRSLRLKSNQQELALIAPHGLAGQDRFDAAIPPGLTREAVEVDPDA